MPKVSKDDFKPYFEIEISKKFKPEDRRAIAQEIIDEIISRTENGLDADNKKFVGYSKTYSREKGQSNVDLTFSGDMLSEIKLLQEKSGKLRIGFERGYDGLGKVEGNVLGTYGQDKPVNKGRNFLGITQDDLNRILAPYEDNVVEATAQQREATSRARDMAKASRVEEPDDE